MQGQVQKRFKNTGFDVEKIRTRLLLIMLLLMVGSLSVLTALNYYFANRALTGSVNQTAAAIGQDYSNRAYAFVNELVIFVEAVAVNPHIINPDNRQEIVDVLADGLQRNNKFTGINYGDLDGNMIRAQGDGAYLGDRAYYQKAIQMKQTIVSEPLISKGSGRLSIAIAVPVLKNGNVAAVIQATMPLDSLNDMVKGIEFLDTGYGFIVDQSGVILAHALKPELNGKFNLVGNNSEWLAEHRLAERDSRLIELFHKVTESGVQTQGNYNVEEGCRVAVFTPVSLPGGACWIVGVSAPQEEVTREVTRLNTILIGGALGCILFGAIVIVLISARFARPEEKYFKAFRYVADAVGIVNLTNGKFVEVNDAFYKIFGYTQGKVIGHSAAEFGLWAHAADYERYTWLKAGNSISNVETVWLAKDGEAKTGIYSVDGIEIGKARYSVFIWHDITKQKQTELALRTAYEEMEDRVEERTQELFAANEELAATNEEMAAMNDELAATNEEMTAMNDELAHTNQRLYEENHIRRSTEEKLLLRERQYRATLALLTRPVDEITDISETILRNALQLVGTAYGFIAMYSKADHCFSVQQQLAPPEQMVPRQIPALDGLFQRVCETGEIVCSEDGLWYAPLQGDPQKPGHASIIVVPLKQNIQVQGILAATWFGKKHTISQEDRDVLRQFGDLAYIALERERNQAKIRRMAFHDVLTDLPNRLSLQHYLEAEMEKARRGETEGAVLFIDLDDLKSINDTFGHSAGDKMIIRAGKYLKAFFAETAFVSRISGDEFIVVIPGKLNRETAADLADRVMLQLCQEYELMEVEVQISASIGIVLYPEDDNMPEEVLKKADMAMYAAKEAGKNCWRFYDPVLFENKFRDMSIINGLRRALAREELSLHYQPQVTADGKKTVGLEALLRWYRPDYGFVSPAEFIPLAEKSRLIIQIGQWVFQEACRFAAKLADLKQEDIRVAVNISPRQIMDEGFVSFVRDTIEANGISPRQLEIEVTESVLIDNVEVSRNKLKQLQDYGIRLALDDFGTGFSSLTYLRNFPVNSLKIDKSFIDRIDSDEMQLKFVNSIINVGHTLGISIVAEGVETGEQLQRLAECRCDYIQGYLFSKPLPESEALKLLNSSNKMI